MSGQGFSVDLEVLLGVSRSLKRVKDDVKAHPARDLDCAPSCFAHGGVAGATSNFAERLQRAVEALTEDAEEIANRLEQTGGAYLECENQVRSLLERAAGSYGTLGDGCA